MRQIRLILIVMTVAVAAIAINAQGLETKYDRFKDETTISSLIGEYRMDSQFRAISWSITATFTGQVAPSNPRIQLILTTTSKTALVGSSNPQLRAIVDGKRELVGDLKHIAIPSRGVIIESASLWIDLATLRRWGTAKVVETQAGQFEWKFSDDGLARIKTFVETFEPLKPKPSANAAAS